MSWPLRRKVIGGYALLLVLSAAIVFWSVDNLHRLGTAANAILQQNYRSILAMNHMEAALQMQDRASLLMLLGRADQARAVFARQTATFYEWYGREKDNITIPGEGEQADRLGAAYLQYQTGFDRLVAATRENRHLAQTYYNSTLRALRDRVSSDIAGLRQLNQTTMYSASARAERIASGAILSVTLVGLVLLILGAVFSVVLSRIVVRPIDRLIAATENIIAGGYELQIEPTSTDELGALTRSFNRMVHGIKLASDRKVAEVLGQKRTSEAIVQSIEDGIIVVDAELRVTLINRAARSFLGYASFSSEHPHLLELLNDTSLFELVKETVKRSDASVVMEQSDVLEILHDGVSHYYQIGINPISGSPAANSGVVLLLRDITRLKEVERMKSEFVMTASHELKTPLTSIGMSVALLKEHLEGALSQKDRELLDAAGEETGRLTSLVNDLLDLSRIEAGRIEMDFQNVPPSLILERACDTLRRQAEEKQIDLQCEVDGDTGDVHADITKATWVVTNLVTNALRHTPSGGWIKSKATRRGDWVHFSVADNGTGIAPEDQSRIFDRFARVKGEQGGTGLGLAICREIVRASGGTIWVESELGKGSTFSFTLAVVNSPPADEEQKL